MNFFINFSILLMCLFVPYRDRFRRSRGRAWWWPTTWFRRTCRGHSTRTARTPTTASAPQSTPSSPFCPRTCSSSSTGESQVKGVYGGIRKDS